MDKTFLKDKIYESMRVDKKEKRRLTENVQARLEQYNDFVQQLTNEDVSLPWDFQRDLKKVGDCIKENNITELEQLKDEYNKLAKEFSASWYDDDLDDWRTGYEWESKFYKKLASLCSSKIDSQYIVRAAVKQELESNFNGISLVECKVSPYNPYYFDIQVKDATGKSVRFRIPNKYGMTEETVSENVHNAITELIDTGKLTKDVNESLTEALNGVDKVVQASQNIVQKNRNTWLPIYYDIKNKAVLTEDDYKKLKDKKLIFKVTELIKPNTAEDIERAVKRALSM